MRPFRVLCAVVCLFWPTLVLAQSEPLFGPNLPPGQAQEPSWDSIAARAEVLLETGQGSLFALNRLREQLFEWRGQFALDRAQNADRIATVEAQIAALGEASEDEPPAIADRRDVLEAQLERLRVPVLLAEESYVRADGLIAEIDSQIRAQDASALTERGPHLLSPTLWSGTLAGLNAAVITVVSEFGTRVTRIVTDRSLWAQVPVAALLLGAAYWLLFKGLRTIQRDVDGVALSNRRGRAVLAFFLSLSEILVPIFGLAALWFFLIRLDLLGTAGNLMLNAISLGAFLIILARWLGRQMFPEGRMGPLRYAIGSNGALRRGTNWLGWSAAGLVLIEQLAQLGELSDAQQAAALLPVQVVASLVLLGFGRRLRQPPETDSGDVPGGRMRRLVGGAVIVVALAVPVLAVIGFAAASERLFEPTVLTLALLALVILLQRLVHDIWLIWSDPEAEQGALAPVLIAFSLAVLALPLLALIWGARQADLAEVWTRFQQGFSIGETTISPTDFILFALVFAIGYLLTRLTQGGLRGSVLPRTKLDQGGKDAVVAGVGYVGIILSAIAAITAAGVNLSNIALVAGALSVGIGFGLQTVVSNFVSGIILLIERPVSTGDWIEVNGQMGTVKDISVRSTRIETFDRTDVIIPNADLISGQVTNWTRGNSIGRVIVPVGVAYGTDVDLVKDILLKIARDNDYVMAEPEPVVLFQNFGDSSLDFEIRAILRDVNKILTVKSEMNTEIAKRFAEHGIEIPFPQRDVWMRSAEA